MNPKPATLHAELTQVKQQSATLEDSLKQYDVDGRVLTEILATPPQR